MCCMRRMEPVTLNLVDLARYIGVSRATLYNMLIDGRFSVPPIAGTNPRRWNKEAVDTWLNTYDGAGE